MSHHLKQTILVLKQKTITNLCKCLEYHNYLDFPNSFSEAEYIYMYPSSRCKALFKIYRSWKTVATSSGKWS
ncbi:hypothetical protein IHE45_15G070900 [Dioscorea alata]|uniref:Uncharacterized protein n=1 Tax=Dioscorea alata TaxID=55571 RepID=A0ACB7UM43_DIOAL|nr:hypothetical protein IHE45_15G070900 [Dioscorea alata]